MDDDLWWGGGGFSLEECAGMSSRDCLNPNQTKLLLAGPGFIHLLINLVPVLLKYCFDI